jgi:DNA-binding CsgD family transcriptional regulator
MVGGGDYYLSPKITDIVVDDYKYYMDTLNNSSEVRLTTRERQVVQLLTVGKSTKQIALCLHVSPKTVDSNRREVEVMNKLGIFSVAELTKYARGHVYVNVSLENRHDQFYIRFDIEDTGLGIAQEKQLEIFESFNQVDGSICRKYGGTGLGLVITRQLAELLGGELTLTSEESKGSVFSFVIPVGLDSTTQPPLDTSDPADNAGIT